MTLQQTNIFSRLKSLNKDLSDDLLIPKLLTSFNVKIEWLDNEILTKKDICYYLNSESPIYKFPVIQIKRLIYDSQKVVYEATLEIQSEQKLKYEPGDTVGIIVKNLEDEVGYMLNRLGLKDKATDMVQISYKRQLPNLHQNSPYVMHLQDVFREIYDLRSIPKKAFLVNLAHFTLNMEEKTRLLQLSSKEGALDYENIIRNHNISFLHILKSFPSCKPPLELLFEYLPQLQPRAYSLINSPLNSPNILKFAFTLICLPSDIYFPERFGLFTGYIHNFTYQNKDNLSFLKLFKRSNPYFKLPSLNFLNDYFQHCKNCNSINNDIKNNNDKGTVPKITLIFLAPGLGIAPYLSFFEHMSHTDSPYKKFLNQSNDSQIDCWLFYGCRNVNLDLIYKDEIYKFTRGDCPVLTRVYLSFSRPFGHKMDITPSTDYMINTIERATIQENIVEKHKYQDPFTHLPTSIKSNNHKDIKNIINNTSNDIIISDSTPTIENKPFMFPLHIQDNLKLVGSELVPLILNGNAIIYLTGDSKGLSMSMRKCLAEIIEKHTGWSPAECQKYVKKMREEKRFLEDTWL